MMTELLISIYVVGYVAGIIVVMLAFARWWRWSVENEPAMSAVAALLWPCWIPIWALYRGLRGMTMLALRIVPPVERAE